MMLYPYKAGSASAKALAQGIGIKRIALKNSKFKGNANKTVINWGSSSLPEEVEKCNVLNNAAAVEKASDKLKFMQAVGDKVSVPEWTSSREEAQEWFNEGAVVICRTKLTGHSGEGIIIAEKGQTLYKNVPKCKLYTKYVPKKDEFRVHVVSGEVIDVRRKALKKDHLGEPNWKIRNLAGGFIYAKDGFEVPEQVLSEAVAAIKALELDFGGVDVIWNNFRKKAYVLEINTAPGLEGSTIDNYVSAFEALLHPEPPKVEPMFKKWVVLDEPVEFGEELDEMFDEDVEEDDQPF